MKFWRFGSWFVVVAVREALGANSCFKTKSRAAAMRSLVSPSIATNRRCSQPSSAQDLARQIAITRREFLRAAAGLSLGSGLMTSSLLSHSKIPVKKRKVVVVTFGGGARDQETFAPGGQENIPHLIRELIPQSAFFTQVVNGFLGGPLVPPHRESESPAV